MPRRARPASAAPCAAARENCGAARKLSIECAANRKRSAHHVGNIPRAERVRGRPVTANFDALAAAEESLTGAGIEDAHAKAIAATVRDSRAGLATGKDVRAVQEELHAVTGRLEAVLRAEISGAESRMQAMFYRAMRIQTGAIVGTIIAAAGVIAAAA